MYTDTRREKMQLQKTFEKIAKYIETTQTLLDKQNEIKDNTVKKAHQVAGVLANKGLIAHDAVNGFVDKIAADETGTQVWDLVEKLANALPTDELGKVAEISSGRELDAFEKLALFGDARADTRNPGMVD
jgi:hypothetical protein